MTRQFWIRHGATKGNLEKRYIGRTDESLCEEGIAALEKKSMPQADVVFVSPMRRCIETAKILYPDRAQIVIQDFRECDFGDFEGKNYIQLKDDARYQAWIDSGGELAFPNGESPKEFRERCLRAYHKARRMIEEDARVAFVVHGGTIMSVLSALCSPQKGYYDFQIENGGGYSVSESGGKMTKVERL